MLCFVSRSGVAKTVPVSSAQVLKLSDHLSQLRSQDNKTSRSHDFLVDSNYESRSAHESQMIVKTFRHRKYFQFRCIVSETRDATLV